MAEVSCKLAFLMNSEAGISIARAVNFQKIGFPHDLKVFSTNHLYLYSSLILTMK